MPRLAVIGFPVLLALLALISPSAAAGLESPIGKPILTISGAISARNAGDEALFDREMLEAIGTETIITKTPWFDGETEFTGVRLDRLMNVVGARGSQVTAVALNDYVTTIPIEDFSRFRAILALKRDGEYMSVRDKGPLFIVYPFDSYDELRSQTYFGRSAWQVARLIVK